MPIEILLVTFILNKIIADREKKEKLQHQNIVISSFFSEIGTEAINIFNNDIKNYNKLSSILNINENWNEFEFKNAVKLLQNFSFDIDVTCYLLSQIKAKLSLKKTYIVSLFSNTDLLEIDSFTDMLWAFYHLLDELDNRDDIYELPDSDMEHLKKDIIRIYEMLVCQWVNYMMNLKGKYPYLFSLAARKNPFSKNNSVIVLQR